MRAFELARQTSCIGISFRLFIWCIIIICSPRIGNGREREQRLHVICVAVQRCKGMQSCRQSRLSIVFGPRFKMVKSYAKRDRICVRSAYVSHTSVEEKKARGN